MPQASEDLRDLMNLMFGDGVDEFGPEQFLKSRGYTLRPDWHWELPTDDHIIQEKELLCLSFLIEEWDYGGIYQSPEKKDDQS